MGNPATLAALQAIGGEVISDELKHYASPYYDPVKAKEYYERTKELKGRTSGLSKTQRQAYTVAKSNISSARKAETEKNQTDQKARLEKLRSDADAARQVLSDKMSKMADDMNNQIKQLADANKSMPLNKIPKNASPKLKEFLTKQNAHIRNANAAKANKQIQKLGQIVAAAQKDAAVQRKAIGDSLRASLQQARDSYKTTVQATKDKFDKADDTELNNIRSQVK